MYKQLFILSFLLTAFLFVNTNAQKIFKVDYEKYSLINGLQVILHQDKSDPIAAVSIHFSCWFQ